MDNERYASLTLGLLLLGVNTSLPGDCFENVADLTDGHPALQGGRMAAVVAMIEAELDANGFSRQAIDGVVAVGKVAAANPDLLKSVDLARRF